MNGGDAAVSQTYDLIHFCHTAVVTVEGKACTEYYFRLSCMDWLVHCLCVWHFFQKYLTYLCYLIFCNHLPVIINR
jgi:hypothetical protein